MRPLASLAELEELDLFDLALADLTPLASLGKLSELRLDRSTVPDLAPLAHIPSLRVVSFFGCKSVDLSGLRHTAITRLSLRDVPTVDLAPLADMQELTSIELVWTNGKPHPRLRHWEVLAKLPKLKRLMIYGRPEVSCKLLAKLRQLTDLMSNCGRIDCGWTEYLSEP